MSPFDGQYQAAEQCIVYFIGEAYNEIHSAHPWGILPDNLEETLLTVTREDLPHQRKIASFAVIVYDEPILKNKVMVTHNPSWKRMT
jgi:hypothetical protein